MIRLLRAFFSAWWYYMTVSAIAYKARWSLYTYALDGSDKDIHLSQLDKVVRYAAFEQLYSTLDKKNALNQHSLIVMLGWDDKQYTQFFAAHQEIEAHESLFSQDITAFVLNDADPLSKIDILLECIDGSRNTAWDAQTDIETFINAYKTQQESVWTDNDEASQDGMSDTTPVEGLQGNEIKGGSLQQDDENSSTSSDDSEELDSNEQLSTTYSTPVQLHSQNDDTSSVSSDDLENGSGGIMGFFVNRLIKVISPSQDPDQGNGYTR